MRLEEKKVVHNIMSCSFPLVQRWFFSFTPHVLVAEQNGQLLGATVLKLIPLPGNRKGGLIYWIFTAPEARGMGAGQRLIESALHFFEDKGCDEIMTWALLHFSVLPPEIKTWINIAMIIGRSLALFDIALIFFPFAVSNGRRIWDWNRVVWGVLAAAAVAVFFLCRT